MDLRPASLLRNVRADLGRPEEGPERDLVLVIGAIVVAGIAQATKPGSVIEVLILVPAVLASVARGWGAPIRAEIYAAVVIVSVTVAVGANGNLEVALFLPVLATLYTSSQLGSVARASAILLVAATAPIVVAASAVSGIGWVPWTSAHVFTFALGLTIRRNREMIEALRAARQELAIHAVGEERRRMARELHDTTGHTLAAMMLHITGARHVLDRDPAEARRALEAAEEVGRHSLDQIRDVVAALRMSESGTAPALVGTAALDHLIDTYRQAGLRIDLRADDDVADLDGPVGIAIHRIAQESLTNVARHAPGNSVSIVLCRDPSPPAGAVVELTVTDRGRAPGPTKPGVGQFGLIGMQERARALGGQLRAGPHDAGWRVAATIPVRAGRPGVAASTAGELAREVGDDHATMRVGERL